MAYNGRGGRGDAYDQNRGDPYGQSRSNPYGQGGRGYGQQGRGDPYGQNRRDTYGQGRVPSDPAVFGNDDNREARTSPYVTGRGLKDREDSIGLHSSDFTQMNQEQLMQARQMEEARQDQLLDNIGKGVRNIRNQALGIQDEVTTQNRMLDDLNNNVDTTRQVVEVQAEKAKAINKKKKKICFLYIIVIVLVAAIIIVQFAVPDLG